MPLELLRLLSCGKDEGLSTLPLNELNGPNLMI